MPTTTQAPRGADLFRHQAHLVRQVVGMNLAGVTHDESLAHPPGGGNSINWVLGHLVWTYEGALPLLGREPVLGRGTGGVLRRPALWRARQFVAGGLLPPLLWLL